MSYQEYLKSVLDDFHKTQDKEKRKWCKERLNLACESCPYVECRLNPKYEKYDKAQIH